MNCSNILKIAGSWSRLSPKQIDCCQVVQRRSVGSLFNQLSPKEISVKDWMQHQLKVHLPHYQLFRCQVKQCCFQTFTVWIFVFYHGCYFTVISAVSNNNTIKLSSSSIICTNKSYLNVTPVIYSSRIDYQ